MDEITPVVNQQSFRGRGDTQTLNSGTFDYALNNDWSQDVDSVFRIRFLLQETAGGDLKNEAFKFEYQHESGGWNPITATSPCQWALSGQYVHLDATTQVIGGGSFVAGDGVEGSDTAGNVSILSQETEHEIALTIDSGQVANDDTIEVKAVYNDGSDLDNYTNTPSLTVVEAAATRRVFVVS